MTESVPASNIEQKLGTLEDAENKLVQLLSVMSQATGELANTSSDRDLLILLSTQALQLIKDVQLQVKSVIPSLSEYPTFQINNYLLREEASLSQSKLITVHEQVDPLLKKLEVSPT
eukprot:TRINITY_DN6138_c0_g1_i1.p1 TRINITY_DN6138_c0_g1~~TRINITY_DN6138_c0_g1_i1.p1  ORF type:complete len:126 (+),score=32.69 TRINITY_DN6138_c0_g1_i1:30-380(+)